MNDTPLIDLGAEAGIAPVELLIVGVLVLIALAYLGRGFWRKRRRVVSGQGCGSCAGCASSGACPLAAPAVFPPRDTTSAAKTETAAKRRD